MKILLFSRSIYPRKGGSSFVTESLASNFSKSEMVVVGESNLFSPRKVERDAGKCNFYYLRSGLSVFGRGYRFFKPLRWLLFPWVLIQATRIAKREKVTHIVGSFPEGFFLLLSLLTAQRLNIPFSAYFHNTFIENRSGLNKWWSSKIQNLVFEKADHVFVMSEGMKIFYDKHYPAIKKFKTLPHTFSQYPDLPQSRTMVSGERPWQLAFTGNFNDSNMEATIRIVDALKDVKAVEMNFYTPVPLSLLKLRGLDTSSIHYKGYLKEEEYFTELAMNDVMVLTHGFEGGYSAIEYETIFPTRTIQMFLTQRPILAHVPANSYLHSYLKVNNAAFIIDSTDISILKKNVLQFLNDASRQQEVVKSASVALSQFYGPLVCKNFKHQLTSE